MEKPLEASRDFGRGIPLKSVYCKDKYKSLEHVSQEINIKLYLMTLKQDKAIDSPGRDNLLLHYCSSVLLYLSLSISIITCT